MVTLNDLMCCFPYNDSINRFSVTGSQLNIIFSHIMRPENRLGEGECYQISSGIKAVYNDKTHRLVSLSVKDLPVETTKIYTICLQGYHYNNSLSYLNLSDQQLLKNGSSKVVSTSAQDVLIEYLRSHQNLNSKVEGRLVYIS